MITSASLHVASIRDVDVFAKIRRGEVRPIESARSDLPEALVAVINRALAPQAKDRFESARDMAHAIASVLSTVQSQTDAQTLLGRAVDMARSWLADKRRIAPEETEMRTVVGSGTDEE